MEGIMTLVGSPSSLQANATAWAWFPDECVTILTVANAPGTMTKKSSLLFLVYSEVVRRNLLVA